MKGSLPPISQEDLHALVDGETDPGQHERVLRFLAASPADAARVETWRRQNETLRAAFARVLAEPIPFSLSPGARARRGRGPSCKLLSGRALSSASSQEDAGLEPSFGTRQAILVGLAFVSGILVATATMHVAKHSKRSEAAGSVPMVRHADTDDRFIQRTKAVLASASIRSSGTEATPVPAGIEGSQIALVVPNLARAGLKIASVEVFPNGASPAFCIFYAKDGAGPAVLCVGRAEGDSASEFRITRGPGPDTVSWRQKGAKYALAGSLGAEDLRHLAEQASADVEAFDRR